MSNILVAYFSVTGTTANIANQLAKVTKADLYGIKPAEPYRKTDLNWMNPFARSTREMKGKLPPPELADRDADIQGHSVIFLGFPIWWYEAPTIIDRFLGSYDFSGKRIILFATSGGSAFGEIPQKLRGSIHGSAKLEVGRMMNRVASEKELADWAAHILESDR